MESETTLFVLISVLSFAYFTLITVTQIIFRQVEAYRNSIKEPRVKVWITKIEELIEDRLLFNNIIAIGRLLSGTVFSVSLFLYLQTTTAYPLWGDVVLATVSATTLLTIFAQVLFRAIAMARGEQFIFIALVMYQLSKYVLFPVTLLAYMAKLIQIGTLKLFKYDERYAFLTHEEKERLAGSVDDEESLDAEEREMIRNIFEFGDTTVKEIMVPRVDLEALPVDTEYQEVLDFINAEGHSRVPVYEENIDSIVGILYAKDILRWLAKENPETVVSNWSLRKLINKPYFVPANKKLDDLMTDMKKNHVHLVVVVDEYGGTEGIVTMEDLLEEIVGEIHDEFDVEEQPIVKLSERTYLVDPHLELDDLAEIIPLHFDIEEKEYNTIGGLFYHEYGDVPEVNTTFEFAGLSLRIRKMDNQKIEEIIIQLPEGADTSEIDNAF